MPESSPASSAPTLFLDVSEIVIERGNSGIQRVVRRLVDLGRQVADDAGVRVVPVVSVADGLRALSPAGDRALATSAALTPAAPASTPPTGSGARWAKRLLRLVPGLYERMRFRQLERALAGLYQPAALGVRPEDVYVIVDSFWLRSSAPRTAARLRRRRIPVVALIYDALSLTNPEYFTSELPRTFRAALLQMIGADVALISISADAAASVTAALPPLTQGEVASFRLGHDVPADIGDGAAAWPAGLWDAAPVFMMVGTFEPRKNHALVVDAFERLWTAGFDDRLLLIGRPGWGVAELLDRLRDHPEAGRRLFVVHDASDAMLVDGYGRAMAAIVASRAEGFGLPLVEALARHLPVIASDIAVFREIAPQACLFFDPASPGSLVAAITTMVTRPEEYQAASVAFTWPDWNAATREFLAKVLALAARQRERADADAGGLPVKISDTESIAARRQLLPPDILPALTDPH